MLTAGVVGGTGYTGVELLRLLVMHPQVELKCVTSRSESGNRVADLFSNLRGFTELCFTEPVVETLAECNVVFFATPNGTAMKMVPELIDKGVRVIDLAADFRLQDADVWKQWYGMDHACVDVLAEAVYGLPEINRVAIKTAKVVAIRGVIQQPLHLVFYRLSKMH